MRASYLAEIAVALIDSILDRVAAEFVDAAAATITLLPVEVLTAAEKGKTIIVISKKQGRIHGRINRVRVGRGSIVVGQGQ